ncbi:MAG: type IV pilin protein [Thiohalocapsa sp.]
MEDAIRDRDRSARVAGAFLACARPFSGSSAGRGSRLELHSHQCHRQSGVNLVELMITVAIVGILAAVAYPTYTNQVVTARRAEIQTELVALAQFMERIYTETGCYNPGTDMDCSAGTSAAPDISGADDSFDYYGIAFSGAVTANSFLIQATPTTGTSQGGDGALRISHLGQRFWDENNDGDVSDANEDDWVRN